MADDDAGESLTALPAAMSDIFFSLVAVVVVMLLALLPALRSPGALAAQRADLMSATVRLDGEAAVMLFAGPTGVRVRTETERFVPLDAIVRDAELQALLRARSQNAILVVAEDGQEAAFLVGSLAGSAGVETLHVLRIASGCGHVADKARVACPAGGGLS